MEKRKDKHRPYKKYLMVFLCAFVVFVVAFFVCGFFGAALCPCGFYGFGSPLNGTHTCVVPLPTILVIARALPFTMLSVAIMFPKECKYSKITRIILLLIAVCLCYSFFIPWRGCEGLTAA